MFGKRLATILVGGCVLMGAAAAQGTRVSTFESNSSMTFHRYLEPFPRADAPEQCRDLCIRDVRCTGWTYYEDLERNPEQLRRVCIMGAGLKDRRSGDAFGRTAGEISTR